MKVLLSIKPEFVKEIFEGRKKFEYRKSIFTKDVTSVIVYSTKPEGMIVGEFKVKKVLHESPEKLWDDTHDYSGITKAFFDEYYYKYDFYLFGLNMDYRKSPFKLMASAMAMADDIKLIGGYCDICGKVPSKYSLRLENDNPAQIDKEGQVILLDGEYNNTKIEYKSICDDCWKKIYNK